MKIYGYPLLIAIIISLTNSIVSASDRTAAIENAKRELLTSGTWVPRSTFVKRKTYCYREYVCKPSGATRFGRNVKVESTKLQRRRSVCIGPRNACQCKTAPPTLACEVKFLKRR